MPFDVIIRSARGLAPADLLGKSDPYCKLLWGGGFVPKKSGKQEHVTKYKNKTLNPVWDPEHDDAHVRLTWPGLAHNPPLELVIQCWDWDRRGGHDFLGELRLTEVEILMAMSECSRNCGHGREFVLKPALGLGQKYVKQGATLCVDFVGDVFSRCRYQQL